MGTYCSTHMCTFTTNIAGETIRMQICIDTPYVTISEFARRSGQSNSSIRREISQGRYVIRPKQESSKAAVLINMVHITVEAAEQAERIRSNDKKEPGAR